MEKIGPRNEEETFNQLAWRKAWDVSSCMTLGIVEVSVANIAAHVDDPSILCRTHDGRMYGSDQKYIFESFKEAVAEACKVADGCIRHLEWRREEIEAQKREWMDAAK